MDFAKDQQLSEFRFGARLQSLLNLRPGIGIVPLSTHPNSILENKEKENLDQNCSTKPWKIKGNDNNFLISEVPMSFVKQLLEAPVVLIKFIWHLAAA